VYVAWLINFLRGDQFGSGFVAINPNSKIPALLDRSSPEPTRVFESGAILLYLTEKFGGAFVPTEVGAVWLCAYTGKPVGPGFEAPGGTPSKPACPVGAVW
jgi:glutathione S-transferase